MHVLNKHLISTATYLILLLISEQFSTLFNALPIIWPESAAILACVLVYGLPAAAGPLFCSFLFFSFNIDQNTTLGMGFAAGIALVMTAISFGRILILRWLIIRFIGSAETAFNSPRLILLLLLIVGPLNGFLSALMVLAPILGSPDIPTSIILFQFFRWWLAMSAGGLIFTPTLYILLHTPLLTASARRNYLLTSAFAIILLYAIVGFIHIQVATELDKLNSQTSDRLANSLNHKFDEIADLNNSMTAMVKTVTNLTNEKFQIMAEQVQSFDRSFVDFVSWSEWVPLNERSTFEMQNNCRLSSVSPIRKSPANPLDVYVPVTYIYPKGFADSVLCLDLAADPDRRHALFQAIQTGAPALSQPIDLAADQGMGLLLFSPVYSSFSQPEGVIASVIVLENLIQTTIDEINMNDSWLQIVQIDSDEEHTLFSQVDQGNQYINNLEQTLNLSFFGQSWRIHWRPEFQVFARIFAWQISLVTMIATLAVLLIQYIAFRIVNLNQTIQQEVSRKTKDLKATQLKAEQASITKSQFLANMSHEIRTPLNAIIGFSELARQEQDLEQIHEHIKGITGSSEALLSLINDVLDYSKLEAGKMELHRNQFALENVGNRIRAIFSSQARANGLDFSVDVNVPENMNLFTDETRVQQILINLCANALKFTSQGHIRVTMTAFPGAESNVGELTITVSDSGIGMTVEEQAGIFEQFTQADASISRKYGGTGLGLSICMTITRLLNGTLQVTSEKNTGSTFTLTIPVEFRQPVPQINLDHQRNNDYRILIVDDNIVNLKVTRAMLIKSGFNVDTADSGEQAIEKIEQDPPDLILMDIQMPGMDGLETTRRLRENRKTNELIIGLTANISLSDKEKCLAAGMNDYLTKPISMMKLSECLSQWLTRPRRMAED